MQNAGTVKLTVMEGCRLPGKAALIHSLKKANVLADIHCKINDAEEKKDTALKDFYRELMDGNFAEANSYTREFTEHAGELRAYRRCANLIEFNL